MKDDVKSKKVKFFLTKFWEKLKVVTYNDIVLYMYQPTDPSSLGIIRFLFGKYIYTVSNILSHRFAGKCVKTKHFYSLLAF